MKLPEAFKEKMLKLLGNNEYQELMTALNGQRQYGLRVNTLKVSLDEFIRMSPFRLEAIPWTDEGFYISGGDAPGRHPYYHAGLYYIQEPSAMLPGQVLGAEPGDRVLDICAAPGGKTVQIAAAMKGRGLLVSNDINGERVKALVKNIELCGIRNAVVLNESPDKLARNFEGYFDKILIDAPCSGEGMFRKDEAAARSWESFKCERCTQLQEPILHYADSMLRSGGTLVYSTCTFSPEEDEQMIMKFMGSHPGYELVEIPKVAGIEGGRPQWAAAAGDSDICADCDAGKDSIAAVCNTACDMSSPARDTLERAARLWPHKLRGEGHFVAKLVKANADSELHAIPPDDFPGKNVRTVPTDLPPEFHDFIKENLNYIPEGIYMMKGRNLYHLPETPPLLDGLKVAKFGWFLGSFEGGRFEPSHSLVTALDMTAFRRTIDLRADSREVNSYLKGETLMLEGEKGLTAVCVDGRTLGWAKQTGDMLKNMYPKGWRRLS